MKFSKYHIVVLSLYLIFGIYFLFTDNSLLYYKFATEYIPYFIVFSIFTIILLAAANRVIGFGEFKLIKKTLLEIIALILYASIFAIFEEVIFRGYIQGYLQTHTESIVAIILSAAIFGFAHAINGASDLRPKNWNWKLISITFVAGLCLGALYYKTDSLIWPTLLHFFIVVVYKLLIKDRLQVQL